MDDLKQFTDDRLVQGIENVRRLIEEDGDSSNFQNLLSSLENEIKNRIDECAEVSEELREENAFIDKHFVTIATSVITGVSSRIHHLDDKHKAHIVETTLDLCRGLCSELNAAKKANSIQMDQNERVSHVLKGALLK